MTIYLIKKKKGRMYKSETIVPLLLIQEEIDELRFCHESSGNPQLLTETQKDVFSPSAFSISISDTKNYWCAVIGRCSSLGIDIEERGRKISPQLVRRLHPLEQQYLSGLTEDSREWEEEFFAVWTRKEAYSKFCGVGMSVGFGTFSVVDENMAYETRICCRQKPEAFVRDIRLLSTLFCSFCSPSPEVPDIRIFDYDGQPAVSPATAAAELLSVRSLSSAELKKKLMSKGFTEEEAQNTAEEMQVKGYTDDEAYAARQALLQARKGKSKQMIRRSLEAKGLGQNEIADALEQLETDGGDELDRALAAAAKVFPLPDGNEDVTPPDEKQLAKIGRRLAALGYGASVIYRVLDRYRD